MANLCEKHNLVIAADTGCVLCRRERVGFVAVSRRPRSHGDNLVTAILGVGLLVAIAALVWTLQTPEPLQGRRFVVDSAARAEAQDAPRARASQRAAAAASPPRATPPAPEQVVVQAAAPIKDQVKTRRLQASLKTARKAIDQAKHTVPITMYSTSWCTICETSRYYLEGRELTFEERDIEADPRAFAEMSKLNPIGSVPTFVVGGHALVGFNPWQLEDMLAQEARKRVSLTCNESACDDDSKGRPRTATARKPSRPTEQR